jgi:hypothetical protein
MHFLIDFISQPWPWYVAGPLISFTMFLLLWFGNRFGLSSNLRTLCAIAGAARFSDFFAFDWKRDVWNLVFVLGLIGGGAIAHLWLSPDHAVQLSESTSVELATLGLNNPGEGLAPQEIFNWQSLATWRGFLMMIVGGFLVGFGTRYAGGCTSGHAISGLSDLQLPSLIATIGFFLGGLTITYFVLPHLLDI